MSYKLEVVILTRDRCSLLEQCIDSVLSQETSFSVNLIISDNSQSDESSHWLAREHPSIAVRRYHSIPVFEHMQLAIKNVSSQYVMLFHDDDILLPGCLQALVNQLDLNSKLSAVSCNAFIALENHQTFRKMLRQVNSHILISTPQMLIKRYLEFWEGGITPFSTYIYRSSAMKPEHIDISTAGKHSDVTMLLNVLKAGPFLWVANPLAVYRVHKGSDSFTYSAHNNLLLLRTLRSQYGIKKNSFFDLSFRTNIFKAVFSLRSNSLSVFWPALSRRKKLILFLLIKISLLRMLRYNQYFSHLLREVCIRTGFRLFRLVKSEWGSNETGMHLK